METLHPDALTIGFAKRFATYKRGLLLFQDIERLKKILSDTSRPVQIIVSGKAHPRDHEGKAIIQRIIHIAREDPFRNRVVFLEDYNMNIGRYLVEGVDVWLNNPRRPMEACGTSGMKATANGALNLSVPDGWWVEGYQPELGWCIGSGEFYDNLQEQDEVESRTIYDILEREIVPLFFDRGLDGLPRKWIAMMKRSMRVLCPQFNSNRMVEEYTDRCYMEAALNARILGSDGYGNAKDLVSWMHNLRRNWRDVQIRNIEHDEGDEVEVHGEVVVKATVRLGGLTPEDVNAQVYYGKIDDGGNLFDVRKTMMDHSGEVGKGEHLFQVRIPCEDTGRFGYTVRILPSHPILIYPVDTGLITWAS